METLTAVAPWAAILITVGIFMLQQARGLGTSQSKLVSVQGELTEFKTAIGLRFDKLEKKAYGNGEGGFMTIRQHEQAQQQCRGSLKETLVGISLRQEKMDRSRDDARKSFESRLGEIEKSIVSLAAEVRYLSRVRGGAFDDDEGATRL